MVQVPGDDKEIAVAIMEAQRLLPEFRRIVEENNRYIFPPYGVPMVKICVQGEASGSFEHIWLEGVFFEGSEVGGQVVAEQTDRPGIGKEEQFRSHVSKITDWMYFEGGKMHGGFVELILRKRAGIDE